jgi:lipoprotein-anchoring transpeptidase ErfK/SrfK
MGQISSILLDAAEVEGRGLQEAVLSAAMLAMVFGSVTSAEAADKPSKASTSKLASFFGGDSQSGEKLQVKSQRLVQPAPRVYRDVLARSHNDMRIIIDVGAQRAFLLKDGDIAFETPISSGRGPRMTARGTFTITEKVRSGKISTIYKCPLPGWMRIGNMPIGMHEGELPGYPASHGCVRMPIESALLIFDHAPRGTTVQIVDSWTPPQPGTQPRMIAAN